MTHFTAPGALDPGFNAGARQTITPSGLASKIHSLLPLADGSMLVASSGEPTSAFAVNLFNADGSLPSPEAFGNSVSSRGHGYLLDSFSSARPIPQLHAYQSGDFHVLSFQREGVHMARYNAAGLPQARHLVDFSALPTGAVAEGPMRSAADGELLYVAFTVTLLNADTLVAVMCITAAGALNPAFNGTGVQLIHLPDTVTRTSGLRGLAVQRHGANAGKVVLAGGWAVGRLARRTRGFT